MEMIRRDAMSFKKRALPLQSPSLRLAVDSNWIAKNGCSQNSSFARAHLSGPTLRSNGCAEQERFPGQDVHPLKEARETHYWLRVLRDSGLQLKWRRSHISPLVKNL